MAWTCVALSADGTRLIVGTNGDVIYSFQMMDVSHLDITRSAQRLTVSWVIPSTTLRLQQTVIIRLWQMEGRCDRSRNPLVHSSPRGSSPQDAVSFYRLTAP